MKRTATVLVGLILSCLTYASAQMAQPTPAPELKKLDYFAGTWTSEATIPPGPWGGGGKFTSNGSTEWMKGNFFLVGHADFTLPAELGGGGSGISILGYDSDKKVYTAERFNSDGRHEIDTGTLNGDTWTWTGENTYSGMVIQYRSTMKMVSPTSYTMKYEVSADNGGSWMTFWDGKATKK